MASPIVFQTANCSGNLFARELKGAASHFIGAQLIPIRVQPAAFLIQPELSAVPIGDFGRNGEVAAALNAAEDAVKAFAMRLLSHFELQAAI